VHGHISERRAIRALVVLRALARLRHHLFVISPVSIVEHAGAVAGPDGFWAREANRSGLYGTSYDMGVRVFKGVVSRLTLPVSTRPHKAAT